jgi:hypothetical protein
VAELSACGKGQSALTIRHLQAGIASHDLQHILISIRLMIHDEVIMDYRLEIDMAPFVFL